MKREQDSGRAQELVSSFGGHEQVPSVFYTTLRSPLCRTSSWGRPPGGEGGPGLGWRRTPPSPGASPHGRPAGPPRSCAAGSRARGLPGGRPAARANWEGDCRRTPHPPPQSTCRPPPPGGRLSGCVTRAFSPARAGSPRGGPRAAGRAEPCDWRRSRSVSSNALSPALPAARTLSPAPPPTPRPHPSSGARLLLSAGSGPGRRAAEQAPVGAAGAPRSEPWEAPTLRAQGAGSRPRRGPRDPERPRESQHPLLPPPRPPRPLFGALSAGSGWERTAPRPTRAGKVGTPARACRAQGWPGWDIPPRASPCGARGTHDHDPTGTVSSPGGLLTRARPC